MAQAAQTGTLVRPIHLVPYEVARGRRGKSRRSGGYSIAMRSVVRRLLCRLPPTFSAGLAPRHLAGAVATPLRSSAAAVQHTLSGLQRGFAVPSTPPGPGPEEQDTARPADSSQRASGSGAKEGGTQTLAVRRHGRPFVSSSLAVHMVQNTFTVPGITLSVAGRHIFLLTASCLRR